MITCNKGGHLSKHELFSHGFISLLATFVNRYKCFKHPQLYVLKFPIPKSDVGTYVGTGIGANVGNDAEIDVGSNVWSDPKIRHDFKKRKKKQEKDEQKDRK